MFLDRASSGAQCAVLKGLLNGPHGLLHFDQVTREYRYCIEVDVDISSRISAARPLPEDGGGGRRDDQIRCEVVPTNAERSAILQGDQEGPDVRGQFAGQVSVVQCVLRH